MGIFGTKHIECPANQWTQIISNAFVQMPAVFDVRIRTKSGAPVVGAVGEKASRWIFPGQVKQTPLAARMTFERGYFNTFYSVMIRPTEDCLVEID